MAVRFVDCTIATVVDAFHHLHLVSFSGAHMVAHHQIPLSPPYQEGWGQFVLMKVKVKSAYQPSAHHVGGGPHESRILAGYSGLNANFSLTFQAIKNLYAHPTYLCFGPFCKFFGDF